MLAEWVKAARLHGTRRTQEALGELVGVSKQNVNSWEKGRHKPSYQQLVRIAQVTGYPIPEEARTAGTTELGAVELSERAVALGKAFDMFTPELKAHLEALVHALQIASLSAE